MNGSRYLTKLCPILIIGTLLLVPTSVSHAQADVPRFEPADCPIDVPHDPPIDCGHLVVPEDYDDQKSRTIRLPVIIIHSRSASPASDPLLFTAGGPGENALPFVWQFASSPYVESRDVIILQPRGGFNAEPSLNCGYAQLADYGRPCLGSLLDQGLNLVNYNTAAMVADLNALRQALDYDEWNLYGESFGARLMLFTMQAYPEGVRSVVLDSVSRPTSIKYENDPSHLARSLQVLLDDCAADPGCAAAYPQLEAQLYRLIDLLNSNPISFDVYDHTTGQAMAVVDGGRLLEWIDWAFYQPTGPAYPSAYLPLLIDQVERGNADLLLPWVVEQRTWDGILAWGLYFSAACQDEFPSADPQALAAQATAYPELGGWQKYAYERALCESWNLPGTTPPVTGPVESDIPTLILAGSYDHVTPPAGARSVAESLSDSHLYEFPGMGHFVSAYSPCAQGIIADFLNDPRSAPDTSCIAAMPGPEFVLPQDVLIAPGIYRVTFNVGQSGFEEILYMICLLIFVAEIGLLIVAAILLLVRRRERAVSTDRIARLAHPLAGLVAGLNLGLAVALAITLNRLVDTERLLLRFGVPSEYVVLFVIPAVTATLTVALVFFIVVIWVRSHWSLAQRVFFSVITLGAVIFTGLMAHWDLMAWPL